MKNGHNVVGLCRSAAIFEKGGGHAARFEAAGVVFVEESLEGGQEFGCEKEFGNLGFLATSCQVSKGPVMSIAWIGPSNWATIVACRTPHGGISI